MVIKICKICGKEFDARGATKCCSPECRKINKRNNNKKYDQSDKGKAAKKRYRQSDKGKVAYKKAQKNYFQSDKGKAARKRHEQSEKRKEYLKEFQKSDKYKASRKKYIQNKIAELDKKFDGDLDLILKDCPYRWMEREAIMQVEYGVSYVEAMYQKIEVNPVCEITGAKDNLVIHHLDSFNLHPEKGADLDNLVRITRKIHNEFHSIYGWGDNTRDQWFEFLEKNRNIYI